MHRKINVESVLVWSAEASSCGSTRPFIPPVHSPRASCLPTEKVGRHPGIAPGRSAQRSSSGSPGEPGCRQATSRLLTPLRVEPSPPLSLSSRTEGGKVTCALALQGCAGDPCPSFPGSWSGPVASRRERGRATRCSGRGASRARPREASSSGPAVSAALDRRPIRTTREGAPRARRPFANMSSASSLRWVSSPQAKGPCLRRSRRPLGDASLPLSCVCMLACTLSCRGTAYFKQYAGVLKVRSLASRDCAVRLPVKERLAASRVAW